MSIVSSRTCVLCVVSPADAALPSLSLSLSTVMGLPHPWPRIAHTLTQGHAHVSQSEAQLVVIWPVRGVMAL